MGQRNEWEDWLNREAEKATTARKMKFTIDQIKAMILVPTNADDANSRIAYAQTARAMIEFNRYVEEFYL